MVSPPQCSVTGSPVFGSSMLVLASWNRTRHNLDGAVVAAVASFNHPLDECADLPLRLGTEDCRHALAPFSAS